MTDLPSYEHIAYDVRDGVAVITLNRPDRLNAFTFTMQNELVDAFDRVDGDDDVRAAVVTGAGRAFCAGVEFGRSEGEFDRSQAGRGGIVTLRIYRCLKPVIAAVNGAAVGVGASMILPMDVRLVAESARIGFVFARRGLVPDGVSAWFLPRLLGSAQAAEWFYSGRIFDAAEAVASGLAKAAVPDDRLFDEACRLARELTEHSSSMSIALTKQLMRHMASEPDPAAAYEAESRVSNWLGRQPDAAEGIQAFLEKRPARFPMRLSRDLPDLLGGN